MKKIAFALGVAMAALSVQSTAQDLTYHQIPSLVYNSFSQLFPKASDVEWELQGSLYKVEFEIDHHIDHEAWFDSSGHMCRHEQDIVKYDLPEAIMTAIRSEFTGYVLDDVEKIDTDSSTLYKVEVNTLLDEWMIIYDSSGKGVQRWND